MKNLVRSGLAVVVTVVLAGWLASGRVGRAADVPATKPVVTAAAGKWMPTEELAHEFLDFESARQALKACIEASDEGQLKGVLAAMTGPPELDVPGTSPGPNIPRPTGLKIRLGAAQIDLRDKSWWVGFRTTFTSDSYSGSFYRDETGRWVASLRSKVHATVSPAR